MWYGKLNGMCSLMKKKMNIYILFKYIMFVYVRGCKTLLKEKKNEVYNNSNDLIWFQENLYSHTHTVFGNILLMIYQIWFLM